jgi:[protein-PII] uridylyltransferase
LHNAKITTIGSRVEDMFYITNADQQPITELQQLDELRLALLKQLAVI